MSQAVVLSLSGIEAHRNAETLIDAVDHIQRMGQKSRLDDSGLPRDYSYEELREILVEGRGYPLEDLERVLEDSCKSGYKL
jgi:hypothetical protein